MGRHGNNTAKSVAAHTQDCQYGAVRTRVDILVLLLQYSRIKHQDLDYKTLEERQLTQCHTMTPIGSRDIRLGASVEPKERTRFRLPRPQTSTRMIQDSLSGLEAGSGKDLTGAGRGTSEDLRKESMFPELYSLYQHDNNDEGI